MQLKNRDKELQQRGKKGQSIEEVEELIATYEIGIKSKTKELAESTVYPHFYNFLLCDFRKC